MNRVADRLAERIRRSAAIPFAVFTEQTLFGEDGYYRRERLPIGTGPECDFVTAGELYVGLGEAGSFAWRSG